ncbi:hypothetical protein VTL71DRAFT_8561 [Oculimacula yallundae]|uniref:Uncharacterized protein n=1 Tax=Oculimacula yallundae TaxID=86028 RepID=A0ABR4CY43_9HELO
MVTVTDLVGHCCLCIIYDLKWSHMEHGSSHWGFACCESSSTFHGFQDVLLGSSYRRGPSHQPQLLCTVTVPFPHAISDGLFGGHQGGRLRARWTDVRG